MTIEPGKRTSAEATAPAASPFLTEPHDSLYPCLFEGDRLRPEARDGLIGYVVPVIEAPLSGARSWIHLTMYGSGISYNWDERGDLDVQVWVDEASAPEPKGLVPRIRKAIAPVNFPKLAEMGLTTEECSGEMRVQYFAKPGKGTAEENLAQRPYACYDLDAAEWILRPEPLRPEFYADLFIVVEQRAKDIAEEADDLLDDLERNLADVGYWEELARKDPDPRYLAQAQEARTEAEASKAAVGVVYEGLYQDRAAAYTSAGKGISDERDATNKLLEVWGVFQKLKKAAKTPLPWEAFAP